MFAKYIGCKYAITVSSCTAGMHLSLLAKNNIFTLDAFADLSSFELIDKNEGFFKDLDIDELRVNLENMITKYTSVLMEFHTLAAVQLG